MMTNCVVALFFTWIKGLFTNLTCLPAADTPFAAHREFMNAIMSALVDALPTLQPHQLACIMMCFAQIGYTPNDAWMACMQVRVGGRG